MLLAAADRLMHHRQSVRAAEMASVDRCIHLLLAHGLPEQSDQSAVRRAESYLALGMSSPPRSGTFSSSGRAHLRASPLHSARRPTNGAAMVDSRELTPGMSMEFPSVPVRLALTGVTNDVRVRAVGQGSSEAGGRRVSDTELIVLPIEGTYRVEAVPTVGGAFPAGSRLGIDITTDSATVESRQGFLQPVDVGALQSHDLVTVSFRAGGWVVTAVTAQQAGVGGVELGRDGQHPPSPGQIDDQTHPWVGPGRFAYRSAISNGARMRPARDRSWGLVLDSSASMRCTFQPPELEHLVNLVAGIFGEWTGRPPAATHLSGLTGPERVAEPDPTALTAAASNAAQPASWSIVTPAIKASAGTIGGSGDDRRDRRHSRRCRRPVCACAE